MAVKVVDLKCSGCQNALDPSASFCEYCGNPVVISSFNSIIERSAPELNKLARALDADTRSGDDPELCNMAKFTQASCYLKLKLYDKALQRFEEAIEENFDNPETYFYAAVALLKGKKAFLTPMMSIKKAEEYLDAALSIENRGVFNYFKAYLKYDFYERKFLRVKPDYRDELQMAITNNLSHFDADTLFSVLGVPCPQQLEF